MRNEQQLERVIDEYSGRYFYMNNYRMKPLVNLDEEKREIKRAVRIQLHRRQKRNWLPIPIGRLAAVLTLFLVVLLMPAKELNVSTVIDEFSFGEVELTAFAPREIYYVVVPLTWTGKESVSLHSIELVTTEGQLVTFEEHGIMFQAYSTKPNQNEGIYLRQQLSQIDDITQMAVDLNSTSKVAFQMVFSENLNPTMDLRLRITYENKEESLQNIVNWPSINTASVEPFNSEKFIETLGINELERTAYEQFSQTRDVEALRPLDPVSIARLYYLAHVEGNYELAYEFYTDLPNSIIRSKEEDATIPARDRITILGAAQKIQELENGEFIETSQGAGYISFFSKDGDTEFGFQLLQNDNGI